MFEIFNKSPQYLAEMAGTFKIGYFELISIIIINHLAKYIERKA